MPPKKSRSSSRSKSPSTKPTKKVRSTPQGWQRDGDYRILCADSASCRSSRRAGVTSRAEHRYRHEGNLRVSWARDLSHALTRWN